MTVVTIFSKDKPNNNYKIRQYDQWWRQLRRQITTFNYLSLPEVRNYEDIVEVNLIRNVNVASIHSNFEDSAHRNLVLTISSTQYATISTIVFIVTTNIGTQPTIPEITT